MGDAEIAPGRIAVITVHGTGDTADGTTGKKWFQNGSQFVAGLKEQLAGRGVEADVHPHLWSGANSAAEREKGARSLVRLIRRLAKSYAGVHLIGHSHGGNVVNDAACMLSWKRKKKRPKLASVTTVGTPFFRTQVTRTEALGAWAFGAMAIISACALLVLLFMVIAAFRASIEFSGYSGGSVLARMLSMAEDAFAQTRSGWASIMSSPIALLSLFLTASAAGVVALVFLVPVAFRGVARIGRAGRRARQDTAIFAIRHPADEAISFLRRVESMPLEPFPRGSVFRGSRTGAIVWGTRAIFVAPLIGSIFIITEAILAAAGMQYVLPGGASLFGIGYLLLVFGLIAAPVMFGAVYLSYRLAAGTVGEFAFRSRLNNIVGGALRGLVFGRDGDIRIGDVSPISHYYATIVYVLTGEVAARMAGAANDASRQLFEKYRHGVFNAEADQNEVLHEVAKDALTWDSLIHTTYFDQPEVLSLCSAYIGGVALGADSRETIRPASPRQRLQEAEPLGPDGLPGAVLHAAPIRSRRKLWVPLLKSAIAAVFGCFLVGAVVVGAGAYVTRVFNGDELGPEDAIVPPPLPYVVGQVLRDCDACPELVVVPGGSFVMGSPTNEPGRAVDEGPRRRVRIAPFAVGRYEVTFDQWEACFRAGGCAAYNAEGYIPALQRPLGGAGSRPVINLTWIDAQAYVRWLSQRTGQHYSLLTEAEWEYAARAGTAGRYSWGDEPPVCDPAVPNGAAFVGCREEAAPWPVGSFRSNPFGLYDMYGNVAEWVEDCYRSSYAGLPTNGEAYSANSCSNRVVRGGSWNYGPDALRSADRNRGDAYLPRLLSNPDLPPANLGFRVARTL